MTKTLPELFAEVCRKVPGFCEWKQDIDGVSYVHRLRMVSGTWGIETHYGQIVAAVIEPLAETIIIGACVAMLPEHWWDEMIDGSFYVYETHERTYHEPKLWAQAPTLAAALLLAVIAQAERTKP